MFQGRLLEVEVGFNKAGFDGASEKPVWIWNFTGGVFWEDFVFLKTENENIMLNP